MLFRPLTASLVSASFFLANVGALDFDVNSLDSIRSAAQTLARGLITEYNKTEAGDPIGIFPDDDYYWWESGAIWEALVEYSSLTGDSQWDGIVGEALQAQRGPDDNYMPPNQTKTLGNDDQSFWGLAALTAAELSFPVPSNAVAWEELAAAVFDTQAQRWDEKTCEGGLRWQIFTFNNGYSYKNALTNGQFFLLASRLARFTGNATYTQWAERSLQWAQDVGLVSDDYAVYDGTDVTKNCSDVNHIQWTASLAPYLEGSAVLYNTSAADTWKSRLDGFLNATDVFVRNDSSILYEVACEPHNKCDTDQKAFKGMLARSLGRTLLAAPYTADTINPILSASASGAAKGCEADDDDEVSCYLRWDEQDGDSDGLSELYSSLEAVQAVLYPFSRGVASANGTRSNGTSSTNTTSTAASASGTGASQTGAASRLEWSVLGLAGVVGAGLMVL